MSTGISRRHFFFGTLLAGVIPRGGFGSVASLRALGYQSPNEKMNIAGIGAGGRAMSVLGAMESENVVALADVDWARGAEGFKRWEKATKSSSSGNSLRARTCRRPPCIGPIPAICIPRRA
ncbi:MAG: hypothetical protein ACRD15_15360 [Vicinamibacterales bacterium]